MGLEIPELQIFHPYGVRIHIANNKFEFNPYTLLPNACPDLSGLRLGKVMKDYNK